MLIHTQITNSRSLKWPLLACAGVVVTACTQGKRTQHRKPDGVVGCDDQPEVGDNQKGRYGVAERLVVLKRSGNAGGGKGP